MNAKERQRMAQDEEQLEGPITINIGNVCGGAMVEAFALKLQELLDNIMDPNTEARKKRELHLVLRLTPKDDRVQIDSEFECTTKLAGLIPTQSRMYIGRDEMGSLYALTEDPRQMHIFTPPKPVEAPKPIEFKTSKK